MPTLLLTIISGLVIAYFATQNTNPVTLHFLTYELPNIPMYMVIIVSLLIGLFLSWLMSLVTEIATGFTLRGKESKIKDYRKENTDLTKKIHQLELENTRLSAETNAPLDDKSL